jgi:hypothetical protein
MSESPPAKGVSALSIVLGLLFAGLWLCAHVFWGSMALMGTLMANDVGAASSDQHMAMVGGVLGGIVMAGAAGIPGGLAFVWRGARKWLWISFALLFIGGVVWQVLAFQSFIAAAASHS